MKIETNVLKDQSGVALVVAIIAIAVMSILTGAYFTSTRLGIKVSRANVSSTKGFFAAEAALAARTEEDIRVLFQNYQVPSGTSPTLPNPCVSGNMGTGNFICKPYTFNGRQVQTFVEDLTGGTPAIVAIPSGEPFGGLSAIEYRYDLRSESRNSLDKVDAILGLRLKSRQIPVFQFAAFYDDDMEIYPYLLMTISGPVHSNNNLFLASRLGLEITGPLTAVGEVMRGQKAKTACQNRTSTASVYDPVNLVDLPDCQGATFALSDAELDPFNGNIASHTPTLTLPPIAAFEMEQDAGADAEFWNLADLRIVLELDNSNDPDTSNHSSGIVVRNADNSVDSTNTNHLHSGSCEDTVHYLEPHANGSPVSYQTELIDRQRSNLNGTTIRTLEVDMQALLNCAHARGMVSGGIDENTSGGLVIYLGIDGPDRMVTNDYGVRLVNGEELAPTNGGPAPLGLTVITPQPLYLWGNYNSVNKIPAAVMTDRINLLSNDWLDSVGQNQSNSNNRVAANTTYQTAVITGIYLTGADNYPAVGGVGSISPHNGGLQNYFVFHESWDPDKECNYLGSMISLGEPIRANHPVSFNAKAFRAPIRLWSFDTDFMDFDNLPPATPYFHYLRQELFTRYYQQD